MNLLSIQDTLKNASDQQLAQLMQSPDSTAPSYLVLSELRRRKEMRSKQAEKPRGTVAEDLTKDESTYADQEGIRSLRMPGYEDEARAAEGRSEGDGIDAMREGGVVRMQYGGRPPIAPGGNTSIPMLRTPGTFATENTDPMSVAEQELGILFRSNPEARGNDQVIRDVATQYGVSSDGLRQRILGNPEQLTGPALEPAPARPVAPAAAPATSAASPAAAAPPAAAPASPPPGSSFVPEIFQNQNNPNTPANTAPPPARPNNAPASRAGGGGGGGGAAAPAGASIRALTPDGEAPNMQTIMERNLGLLPGMPQELLDRIRSSRTNESERRREAQNMSLIEAGLRIASSNNPRLAGAIGEGAAPAVQAYGQQLSQIRQDQRADLQTEMATAQFDLQRRYAAGQISATEYRTALTELGAFRRAALQEAGQNARSSASFGSASADRALTREAAERARIGRNDFTPEELVRLTPEQRSAVERQYQMRNPRGADVSGLSGGAAVARTELENARKELNEYLSMPPGNNASATARTTWENARKRAQERVTAAEGRYNSFMDRLGADRPGSPGAGTGGGAQYQYTPNGVVPVR
jgi:hypothetical protein